MRGREEREKKEREIRKKVQRGEEWGGKPGRTDLRC
jgi:hypothetical protein